MMATKNEHAYDLFRFDLEPVLQSKMEEFHMLGYDKVTVDDVWECMTKKKWKKPESKQLHELVSDVYRLKVVEYMSYITIEAYKAPNFFESAKDS